MIYLASTSPRRKILLKEHGIRFKIVKPDYHEPMIRRLSAGKLVQTHAFEKGKSCVNLIQDGTVVSADTIVYFKRKIIGKPKSMAHAEKILFSLQGRWHEVLTGVAILRLEQGKIQEKKIFVVKTKIKIKPMTREQILKYLKRIHPLDKAGAYAIQVRSGSIVEKITGSFSNAVGLPMERLSVLLKTF